MLFWANFHIVSLWCNILLVCILEARFIHLMLICCSGSRYSLSGLCFVSDTSPFPDHTKYSLWQWGGNRIFSIYRASLVIAGMVWLPQTTLRHDRNIKGHFS